MKRRFSAIFALAVFLILQASFLFSCENEEPAQSREEIPKYSTPGDNFVKSELEGAQLSSVVGIFANALEKDANTAGIVNEYDFQGDFPFKEKIIIKDGVFYHTKWEGGRDTVKQAAAFGEDGLKLISYSEKDSEYILNDTVQTSNTKLFSWIPKIQEAIVFAEENLDLPAISLSDTEPGEDGFLYLSDEYSSKIVSLVYTAYVCISENLPPHEANLEEISARSQELLEKTSLKIGIGLDMKRIAAAKIVCFAEGISDYTNSELSDLDFDIQIKLDSSYKNTKSVSGYYRSKSDKNGSIDIDRISISAVRDKKGTPKIIKADVSAKLTGVEIGTDEDTGMPVIGERDISLKLVFNPFDMEKSVDLDFYDTAANPETGEKTTTSIVVDIDSFRGEGSAYIKYLIVIPSFNINWDNPEKQDTVKTGSDIKAPSLPDEAKALLGIQ